MLGNAMTNFIGGSPMAVLLRLIVMSFVVGLLLQTFGFDPASLFNHALRAVRHLIESGFSDVRQLGRALITGAMVVVPVWLVLRLIDAGRGR